MPKSKRWPRLATAVRAKRGDRSLRQAATDSGVAFQTLFRAEHGQIRSIESFRALCVWTHIDPNDALELTPDSRHDSIRQQERQAIVTEVRKLLEELL